MKTNRAFLLLAIGSMAFYACNKIEEKTIPEGGFEYTFVLGNADENSKDTRSYLEKDGDAYFVQWENGDQVGTFTSTSSNSYSNVTVGTPSTLKVYSTGGLIVDDYIYGYYPYSATNKDAATNSIAMSISASQTQTNTKWDQMPMVMIPLKVTEEIASTTNQTVVTPLQFAALGALIDFKVFTTNTAYAEEKVESILYSAPGLSGGFSIDITKPKSDLTGLDLPTLSGTEVRTTLDASTKVGSTKATGADVFMVVAPGKYQGTVTVRTNVAVYTYELSKQLEYKRGRVKVVGVDLDNAASREVPYSPEQFNWAIVKDASSITVGSKIIIAASGSDYALGTTQNSSNRKAEKISKSGDALLANAAVQVFEVVAGTKSNTYAFKAFNGATEGKYIYASSSSSNELKSQDDIDDNASWTVTITSGGVATVKAQGTNTKNLLKKNSSSDLFSCYGSGQADVAIYLQGASSDPNAKAIISNGKISVAAAGASADYEEAYELRNINEEEEDITLTATDNILNPTVVGGNISFSMAPNYTTSKVTGSITLTLDSDESVSATIPVEQKSSSLAVSVVNNELIIPANSDEITFTITSPDFGWSITADDDSHIAFDENGEASASPVTVTVTSDIASEEQVQTIATLTVFRNGNEDDPQAKTIYVKKEATSSSTVYYTKATTITPGKKYLIVGGNSQKVLVPSTGSGKKNSADVTITSDGIISTTTVDSYAVTIIANGANYDITFVASNTTYYLTYGSSTNLSTPTSSSETKTWKVTNGKYGTFRFADVTNTTRGLVFRGNTTNQFGGYAISNIDGEEYFDIDLYEYQGN